MASFRKRTCFCGKINENAGKKITICGWIAWKKTENSGCLIELRDATGKAEIKIGKEIRGCKISSLSPESILSVTGKTKKNGKKFWLEAEEISLISRAKKLPIIPGKEKSEEKRMKYRYLDLRSERMHKNILLQAEVKKIARKCLEENEFTEIETPVLSTHVPEGSGDFVVSGKNKSRKFILPQSPQLYKQLAIIGGIEKYYQIAKCFSDEDLRAFRQPEFTQLDIEMSFAEEKEILALAEGLMKKLFREILGAKIKTPFKRMEYAQAFEEYGCDKPDTRFGLKMKEVSQEMKGSKCTEFEKAIASGGTIKAFKANCRKLKPKDFNELEKKAKEHKANLYILGFNGKKKSKRNAGNFMKKENILLLQRKLKAKKNETIFITAGDFYNANNSLRKVRLLLGAKLGLINKNKWNFLWVTKFPFFKISDLSGKMELTHHPFVAPEKGGEKLVEKKPLEIKSRTYDLVLNGVELGGGGVRNTDPKIIRKILKKAGYSEKEIKKNFGFFLNAFNYGTPPHAGMAMGIERLSMLLAKEKTIRDVIAFPKNEKGLPSMEGRQ